MSFHQSARPHPFEEIHDRSADEGAGFVFVERRGPAQVHPAVSDAVHVANQLGATPMQVALAWLLRRAPNILLIPGTSSGAYRIAR